MRLRTAAGLLTSGLALTVGPVLAGPASAGAADKPDRSVPAVAAARAVLRGCWPTSGNTRSCSD